MKCEADKGECGRWAFWTARIESVRGPVTMHLCDDHASKIDAIGAKHNYAWGRNLWLIPTERLIAWLY